MSDQNRPSLIAPLGGVVVGVAVFLGVNITTGRAIIPTVESIANPQHGMTEPVRPPLASAAQGPAVGGPYQTVCAVCHQADGNGLPGAFPPLAGSEWLNSNPEIPVRVVLLGLSGPIDVKGTKFNAIMPPPPGMTDATIAEAITFARSNFGNHGAAVTAEFVKKVRDSLAGRTTPNTAEELAPLKGGGAAAGAAAPAATPGASGPTGAARP